MSGTYLTAAIKGNPYTLHAKAPGADSALCGRKPGKAKRHHRMVDRTGWYCWASAVRQPTCKACIAAMKEPQ